ncbi:hypothetical protein MA9V2_028 [Chryseobacterium phage MA9V-2]|nr:hypothetical protein MA9V2_028 [Chryseobacterium phage MA9V-2]
MPNVNIHIHKGQTCPMKFEPLEYWAAQGIELDKVYEGYRIDTDSGKIPTIKKVWTKLHCGTMHNPGCINHHLVWAWHGDYKPDFSCNHGAWITLSEDEAKEKLIEILNLALLEIDVRVNEINQILPTLYK